MIKPSDYAYRAKKTIVGRHHRTTAAKTEITKRKQKLILKRGKMEEPTITGRRRNRANCVKPSFYTGKNFPKENFSEATVVDNFRGGRPHDEVVNYIK